MGCPSTSREIPSRMSPCSILVHLMCLTDVMSTNVEGMVVTVDCRLHMPWRDNRQEMTALDNNTIVSSVSPEPSCSITPLLLVPFILWILERVRMRKLKFWGVIMSLYKSQSQLTCLTLRLQSSLFGTWSSQRCNSWIPGWWHLTWLISSVLCVLYMLRFCWGSVLLNGGWDWRLEC